MLRAVKKTIAALESGIPCSVLVEHMINALERVKLSGHHYVQSDWTIVPHPDGLLEWEFSEGDYFLLLHNGKLLYEVLLGAESPILHFPETEEMPDDVPEEQELVAV